MKKKLLWGIVLFFIIIGIILFLAARYADRVVDPYVRSMLDNARPMNHRISYKRIRVNLISQVINIKDVKIQPDSSLVKDENLWMEISVDNIKLTDFKIIRMLLHKALEVGDLILVKPEVYVHLPINPVDEVIENVAEEEPVKARSQLLKSISLSRIMISDGHFQLIRNDVVLARSNDIDLLISRINLIKNNLDDPIGYSYGDVRIDLSEINIYSESGLYDMSLDGLSVTKSDSSAVLKGFRMIPKYDKKEFSGYLKFQTDRFDVSIGKIRIDKIGFRRLLDGRPLEISGLLIDSLYADIYRDKNVAADTNRFPPFYNESFLKINIPLLIDTVLVTNSRILYGELAEEKTTAGEIALESFNVRSYYLSNYVADSTATQEMRLFVNAKVMGEGPLNAELALPLEGNMHDFSCSGSVGAMMLSPLNGMLEPSINMTFKGGRVNRLTFDFTANDTRSSGWMEFLYQDLDVVLLGKEPGKEKGFVSYLANTMTLSNNPAPGKELKIVEIGYDRNKNKGIINYVWKTIQSGMVRTIIPIKKFQINRKSEEKKVKDKDTKTKKKK
jgi:hypothetical protein